MNIILNHSSMTPIYEQLMEQIKQAIICGRLSAGDPLPSVRAFAAQLRISALTVKKAYDRLEAEGFVQTIHGKGTYVAASSRQLAEEANRRAVENDFAAAIERARQAGMTPEDITELIAILLEEQGGRHD